MIKKLLPLLMLTSMCDRALAQEPMSPKAKMNPSAQTEVPIIRSVIGPNLDEAGKAFKAPSALAEDMAAFPKDRSIIYTAGGRWPAPTAISHCWVNPEDGGTELIADLQQWAAKEYKKADIGFSFEGKCVRNDKPNQIRTWIKRSHIWLTDGYITAGAGLSWIGPVNAPLGGSDGPGTMNIEVAKDVTGYPNITLRSWIQEVTRATFVHELGHALGLAHEQERSDAPICQDQRGTLPSGGNYLFVGQYDPNSIMNYCKSGANAASLSDGDIAGLRTLYPKAKPPTEVKPPANAFTIRSRATNQCLEIPVGSPKPNVMIDIAACDGSLKQAFVPEPAGGDLWYLKAVSSGLCLDVPGSNKDEGSRIQQFACNQTKAQKWKLEARGAGWVSVKNEASKKCLGVLVKDKMIQQWACGLEVTKSFGFFPLTSNMPVSGRLNQ